MAVVLKIDSNVTGLRYSEELSIGTVDPSAVWRPLEPNAYADFGGEISKVARTPINPNRQRKKGVTTDLDVTAGFNTDLTQENLQDILQGFFFANLRTKIELAIAIVDGTGNDFEPTAGGDAYVVNDLLFAKGFDNAANNGLHVVSGIPAATTVPVTSALVTAAGQTGIISHVGFEFAAGDADIDAAGTLPALTTTVKDLTTLGLDEGEWLFLGDDGAAFQFIAAANNGFARIRSIATNRIEFDKTQSTLVTEVTTTETIRIFFGRHLRNETSGSIVRRTYQLERTLGAPDDALPTQIQAEYMVGTVPNELVFNIPTADKLNMDLSFVGTDFEQIDGPTALKAGTRPDIVEADAFNTSSDFVRKQLAKVVAGDAAPTPLFAFIQELTLTVNNSAVPNKACGTLGAFDVTVGDFAVTATITAYFSDITAVAAVRDNDDVTLDFHVVNDNQGISIDVPLVSLGDGRPTVEKDAPVVIPLTLDAATGAKVNSELDFTLSMTFWDFLPTLAES